MTTERNIPETLDNSKDWKANRFHNDSYILCPACQGKGCSQCAHWGTVKIGSPEAKCIHTFGPSTKIGKCLYKATCTKCGHEHEIDTSD